MLLDKNIAQLVLDHALSRGADFAEIFVEKTNIQKATVLGQKVHAIQGGIDFGLGIRMIYGHRVLYGYTNIPTSEELLKIVSLISEREKTTRKHDFESFTLNPTNDIHPVISPLGSDIELDSKISYLFDIDKAARSVSEMISQVTVSSLEKKQQVEIFNSEGLQSFDTRNYIRIVASSIAEKNGEQSEGYEGPGALSGFEFAKTVSAQDLGSKVAEQALVKLNADPCPAGKMPVIIDNGFGGVIFHEACGHLLETTSVQKKASVFWDKMDQQIANPVVSAVDDGTLKNEWGSINIDDEGMKTQKTQLIKDGMLTSFLVDKIGAMRTGFERTGSGRRQSYRFAPASRMRNTFIEPGKSTLEEMVSSIDKGIYCKKMGGGSVSPGTGEFNFAAQESYLIENGKITKPLKSATLIGTGPEVLQKISMVGDNFELAAGMCGSVSGAVPTTVGQPALKIDEILVGGQA
jgi:TldD protein